MRVALLLVAALATAFAAPSDPTLVQVLDTHAIVLITWAFYVLKTVFAVACN